MTEAGPIPERQVLEEQRNRAEITQKNCRLDGIPLLIGPLGALGAVLLRGLCPDLRVIAPR
jgi:hypothetical protein